MDAPEERVRLVLAESERLKQYLHSLPPEAWRKPSACDRWEGRDVVAHLALGAEIYAERLLLRHTRKTAFPRAKQRTTVHNKVHDTPRPAYPRRCPCRLRAGRRSHAGPGGEVDCPPPQPPGTG